MNLKQSIFIRINFIFLRNFRIWIENLSNYVWNNFPFGNTPKAKKEEYLRLAEEAKKEIYPEIDEYEKLKGFKIDKEWLDDLALHTQITVKNSKLCYAHGRLLYTALLDYISKQNDNDVKERITIIETGTAKGFSSLCMAKALDDSRRNGIIITFDFLPHFKKMYWNLIDDVDGPKKRSELLDKWKKLISNYIIYQQGDTRLELKKLQVDRINFAFLDGAHTYEDVMYEFNEIKNSQINGDIIVFDDYSNKKFSGVVRAVDKICNEFGYEKKLLKSLNTRGYIIAEKIT